MKIGITGPNGRLGSWMSMFQDCVPLECDIGSRDDIRRVINDSQPDVIINCAAYTDVDGAEDEENQQELFKANLRGPVYLRVTFDGHLIHLSTGHVFDGKSAEPYEVDAERNPVNAYGWSKLGGEAAVSIEHGKTSIVRVYDLWGVGPKIDFVSYVIRQLSTGQRTEFSTKLYGTPTFIPHLAEALFDIAHRGITGTLHVTGDTKPLSRFAWAKMIAEVYGFDQSLVVPSDAVWGKAPRPPCVKLSLEKTRELGIPLYSPSDGLTLAKELLGHGNSTIDTDS